MQLRILCMHPFYSVDVCIIMNLERITLCYIIHRGGDRSISVCGWGEVGALDDGKDSSYAWFKCCRKFRII